MAHIKKKKKNLKKKKDGAETHPWSSPSPRAWPPTNSPPIARVTAWGTGKVTSSVDRWTRDII